MASVCGEMCMMNAVRWGNKRGKRGGIDLCNDIFLPHIVSNFQCQCTLHKSYEYPLIYGYIRSFSTLSVPIPISKLWVLDNIEYQFGYWCLMNVLYALLCGRHWDGSLPCVRYHWFDLMIAYFVKQNVTNMLCRLTEEYYYFDKDDICIHAKCQKKLFLNAQLWSCRTFEHLFH